MQKGKSPYSKLGRRLLEIRRSLRETVPEVSGAVELDTDIIDSYERGDTRPSEDVLSLLISHFDIKDDEADELWELAGYIDQGEAPEVMHPPLDSMNIPTVVVVPIDNKIVYTDKVSVTVNNHGVMMNFMQEAVNGQSTPVSRVGMSLDHAKRVLDVLAKTISQAEANKNTKNLPGSKKD